MAIRSSRLQKDLMLGRIATVKLTAANIIAMYATPVAVLAAVSGKMIVVDSIGFVMTRTATAFTGGGGTKVQYGDTEKGGGTGVQDSDISSSTITGEEGKTYTLKLPTGQADKASADITGVGLYITNKTSTFAAGTGTAVLTIRYHLI